ncbi:MAG: peptidylprolyl isomerase [Bacteroidetes bacterium]|nr:peptidylprolyl isomerase [Bacteroidota bacterium]
MKQLLVPILVFLFLPSTSVTAQGGDGRVVDRIVAVVGDEIITESELQIQLLQENIPTDNSVMRRRVLDAMMNDKLVLAQAVLDSVEVTEEEVTRRLEEQIRKITRYYGSEQRLQQVTGMTVAQMKRDFRDDIRKRAMMETIQQMKFGSMDVTHREVLAFYETYRDSLKPVPEQVELRQIAIFPRVVESFRASAREKAERILDSLRNGANFEELARRHSDDVGSARNGGSLGLARRGVFVREFEQAAFALEPGQVSDVVETQFGYHIIKLKEKMGEAIEAQHILIKVEKTGESDQAAIDTLNVLRQRILDGADFAALARQYSEDEATRKFGGTLGLVEVPELSDDMKTVQQQLSEGDISEPVKIELGSDYAYAIVQLLRRVPPHPPTLEDDYQRIANFARFYKQNREYAKWIDSIKENVSWEVRE